ncbi:hypothetical protein GQ457_11G019720 [Hibiscus cannabinus]
MADTVPMNQLILSLLNLIPQHQGIFTADALTQSSAVLALEYNKQPQKAVGDRQQPPSLFHSLSRSFKKAEYPPEHNGVPQQQALQNYSSQ